MAVENLPTIDDGIDHIARKFFGSTWDENYGGAIGGISSAPDVPEGTGNTTEGMDGVYEDYGDLMREEGGNDEMMGWQGGGGGDNGQTPMNMQYSSQQQYQQQQQQYQQQQYQQHVPLAPLLYTPNDDR